MAVKNTTICNIQSVSVCRNVSVNYMVRPLSVRPSSGCILHKYSCAFDCHVCMYWST